MIRQRGDKWTVVVYDSVTKGKRWVGTYDTRKLAVKAEAAAIVSPPKKRDDVETCDSFADRWVDDYPRDRESTNIGYRERVSLFATDFKGVPLNAVSRLAARRWVLDNPGRHKAVRAMFTDAMNEGLTDTNPFLGMRLPGSKGRKDDVIPTMDDVAKLAASARKYRGRNFEAFVLTAAYTGMRPAELYALEWQHVHFAEDEIAVIASHSSISGQTTTPKNHQVRTVVMPPPAKLALQEIRKPSGFVFETVTGKRLTGRTLHYQWDKVRTDAGMDELDFYALRHAAATHLLNVLGIPAHQVAAQLGHTDGGVLVMRLYGHPSASVARDAIKAAYRDNVVSLDEKRKEAS